MELLGLLKLDLTRVVILIIGALCVFALYRILYNLFLHPLRRYPGPLLRRATALTFVVRLLQGRQLHDILALHARYGPVVRVGPDELSFQHEDAWRDIYGHASLKAPGNPAELPKCPTFYRSRDVPPSILGEDHDVHALIRRRLAHGFSDRAMREQEPLIGRYVDLLIRRLREASGGGGRGGYRDSVVEEKETTALAPATAPRVAQDMTAWYNLTTFDILGDLAFGEPFGCLEKAEYDPWVRAVNDSVMRNAFMLGMRYLGLERLTLWAFNRVVKTRMEHWNRTGDMLGRRAALGVERHDLIEGLLKRQDETDLPFQKIQANAGFLIVAGSETTATLLCGVTYLLLRNPECFRRLTAEVRAAFATEDQISLLSVAKLQYMLACLNEALRLFPPVPGMFQRVVPKGGANLCGEQLPEGTIVAVWQWVLYHSDKFFADPNGFHPERFLGDERFANDNMDMFQPFSVGPRNCIGRSLALAEMRLILARIIFNFDMRLAEPEKDWFGDNNVYVLWEKPPLKVYLDPVAR